MPQRAEVEVVTARGEHDDAAARSANSVGGSEVGHRCCGTFDAAGVLRIPRRYEDGVDRARYCWPLGVDEQMYVVWPDGVTLVRTGHRARVPRFDWRRAMSSVPDELGLQPPSILARGPHSSEPQWVLNPHERRDEWRRLFSEFFGTFLLVIAAAGAPVVDAVSHGQVPIDAQVVAPVQSRSRRGRSGSRRRRALAQRS